MLKSLTIQNYALIENLDVSFPEHLVIITGETGAGKSILLGALSLLMGAKCDVSALGDKDRNCVVEAEFEDGPENWIIRRVVAPSGRSRSFVNDEPVSVDELRALSSRLVDIHNQNQQLLLHDGQFQMKVVDLYAADTVLLDSYSALFERYSSIDAEVRKLESQIAEAGREREYIEFQYRQLSDASLVEGEIEELEAEQNTLANAESIKDNLSAVLERLTNENYSTVQNLKESENLLSRTAAWMPQLAPMVERLENCRLELKDMEEEIGSLCEQVNVSPERLQAVDDRIALLTGLMRKFGVSSVAELIAKRDGYARSIGGTDELRNMRDDLLREKQRLFSECSAAAEQLHQVRCSAASRLAAELTEDVHSLAMEHARLVVDVASTGVLSATGCDEISFLFSANGGELLPLRKCASGGEMSRLMLCIKALMAARQGMPTMIFDEIDTGVSGGIADKMGDLIGRMGEDMQVIAITHLPQIASKGDAHFVVSKSFDGDRARTTIFPVSGESRVVEVARMLSGSELTEAAIANARDLLTRKLF